MSKRLLRANDLVISTRNSSGFKLGPVNIDLFQGKVLAILGANGAGKSTLFAGLVGDIKPTSGTVSSAGNVELVRQSVTLPSGVEVSSLLEYLAEISGQSKKNRRENVSAALSKVDLIGKARSKTHELSGGQIRRLLIAIGLISNPGVILLDEPSAGLDLGQRAKLKNTIEKLKDNTAVAISTHIVEDISELATDVLHLRDGIPVFYGSASLYLDQFASGFAGQEAWTRAFTELEMVASA